MVYSAKSNASGTISQFLRKMPITITPTGTNTPSNYQVLLDNLLWKPQMQSSFQDIRFNTLDGDYIDYWSESHIVNTSVDAWVELPDAISNGEYDIINMYYGNAGLSDGSDGSDTFDLYNDGPITTTHQSTATFGTGYAIRVRSSNLNDERYLVNWANAIAMSSWLSYRSTSNLWAKEEYDGSVTTTTVGVARDTDYHIWDIGKITGTAYYNRDGIDDGTLATGAVANANRVVNYSADTVIDWYAVRKFILNEPTISYGTPQHQRRVPQFM